MIDRSAFLSVAAIAQTVPGAGVQLWGVDAHGAVWTVAQADPGGAWGHWGPHGEASQPVPMSVVASSADGARTRLYLYALDAKGNLWASLQEPSSQKWGAWQGPGYAGQSHAFTAVTAAHDEIWCLDAAGKMFTCWGPPGAMSGWVEVQMPLGPVSTVAAVTMGNGAVALFATDWGSSLWSCWQTSANGDWTAWSQVSLQPGERPAPTALAAVATPNGSGVMLWVTESLGGVWNLPLPSLGGSSIWQGAVWNGQDDPLGPIAAASQNDGTLMVVGVGPNQALWSASQNDAGAWGSWIRRVVPCVGNAFTLSNDSDSEAFFLEGPPASWNGENGGVHTLVLPGLGLLRLTDGEIEHSYGSIDPLSIDFWPVALSDSLGGRGGVYHDLAPLIIEVHDDGSYLITTQGAMNPIWTVSGPLRDGAPWIGRSVYRQGESLVVDYDTSFYGSAVDLCIVRASEALRANPLPLSTRKITGKGIVELPVPGPGGYVLKGCVDGRAILSHGRFFVKSGSASMPLGHHIMSTTAAASSTALHVIATVMDAGHRSMWHGERTPGSDVVTWTQKAGGDDFPVAESEIVLHSDGTLTYFALDDDGRVRMMHGDDPWSPAGWNSQGVAFTDLTASHENGVLAIYARDESGSLWVSLLAGGSWGAWQALSTTGLPAFGDISSAAGYIAVVDVAGAVWFLVPDSTTWVQAPASGTVFTIVDMSWDAGSSQASLWAVDGQGVVWSGAIANGVATMASVPAAGPQGLACPVPITGDFCVVEQDGSTLVWGVSGLVQLWGGACGHPLWDGPSWGGLRLEPAPPISAAAVFLDMSSQRQTILVSALSASAESGSSLWTGRLDATVQPSSWNLWHPAAMPDGQARIAELVAAHTGATNVWARNVAGQLFPGSFAASGDLTWRPAVAGIIARVAAALLPDGSEAVWVVRPDGGVQQSSSASGFQTFAPVAGVMAREISVASAGAAGVRRTLFMGLDASRVPFDFAPAGPDALTLRSPAFGIPVPGVSLLSVEMGTWSAGAKLRAFALDADGWLWSASEDGSDHWGQAWEGPRWKGQPARFSRFQSSGDMLLAIDTAGLLWCFDASAEVWAGPDWGDASMLSNAMAAPPAATRLLGDPATGQVVTSTRSTQTLVNPAPKGGGRYSYEVMIEGETRSSVFQVALPAGGAGQYFLNGPTGRSYPNDPVLYPSTDGRMNVGYLKNLLFPVSRREQVAEGVFELVTVRSPTAEPVATRFSRTSAIVPHGLVAGHDERHLKINPVLAFTPSDSAEQRAAFRVATGSAAAMITNIFAGFSIVAELLPVQEVDVTTMVDFVFTNDPTAALLKAHGRDDAVTVIWCSQAANRQGAGLSGGLPGVRSADPDFSYFGVIALLMSPGVALSASWVARNTCHEICHFLGLTHASSLDTARNLMLLNTLAIGPNLNLDQLWIIQNSVMVEERIAVSAPDNGISIIQLTTSTATGWGLFDGPGTDAAMFVSLLRPDGSAIWTGSLSQSFSLDHAFSAGSNDVFHFSLPKLDLSLLATARIQWGGTMLQLGDTWSSNGFHVRLFNNSHALLATADVSQPFSLSYASPNKSAPIIALA